MLTCSSLFGKKPSHWLRTARARFLVAVYVCLSWLAVSGRSEAAPMCDTGICVGGSACMIGGGTFYLTPGCILDFGAKDVTLSNGGRLVETTGVGFTVMAHNLTMKGSFEPNLAPDDGATLNVILTGNLVTIEHGGLLVGKNGTLNIQADGDVNLGGGESLNTAPFGAITIDAATITVNEKIDANAGHIDLHSRSGPVVVGRRGRLRADNTTVAGVLYDAGEIQIEAEGGGVTLGSSVFIRGGSQANAGMLTVVAEGDVAITGPIAANSVKGNGGGVDVTAGGHIAVSAPINVNGKNGQIILHMDGSITTTLRGALTANGSNGLIDILAGPGQALNIVGIVQAKAVGAGSTPGTIMIGNAP